MREKAASLREVDKELARLEEQVREAEVTNERLDAGRSALAPPLRILTSMPQVRTEAARVRGFLPGDQLF